MSATKIKLDDRVKVVLALLLLSQLLFINGIYLFLGMLCLYIITYYLQQPHKASVFTIILFYHFLQVISGVWQACYLENDLNYRSANMGIATLISLLGLLVMFLPIIYYQRKIPAINRQTLKEHADKFSLNKTYYTYVVVFFVTGLINGIRFLFPGYTQFLISIVGLKWFFFLIFGFQCILKNKRKREFYFFIVLEFVIGFYSFFSDFKTVLFFVAVLYLTLFSFFSFKKLILGSGILIVTFFLATIWTTVKVDYRKFLNKGAATQGVEVSQNEALYKLYEITNTQGRKVTSSATEKLLDRLQGTYHLAKAMEKVPDVIPYQSGKNWGETFLFVFTPRLFNPDKEQINTSEKATKYTGINYAGREEGTAYSLGYFADCYVDFGLWGMLIPLFAIGLLLGFTYFYFLRHSSPNYIFNYSVVSALYMRFFALEMDSIFFIGGLFTDLIVYFLLSKFFFPWLYQFLLAPRGDKYSLAESSHKELTEISPSHRVDTLS